MGKITRVRTGCWTCKKRHRKCDEAKPSCNNCLSTNRECEGYERKLLFDITSYSGDSHDGGMKRKPKRLKKHDSLIKNEILLSGSTPMTRAGSLGDSKTSSLGLNTLHESSMDTINETSIHEPKHTSGVIEASHIESQDLNTNVEAGEVAKFPLSQVFGDLFSVPEGMEKVPKIHMDTALNDLLAAPIIPEPLQNTSLEAYSNFENELLQLIGKNHVFDDSVNSPPDNTSLVMSYQEENRMLKHFFQNLLPLLDAHPQSPWPALALRYCDFDVARSCFISLACIHIYESRKGGNEYYDKGMAHIHSTMSHLIDSISSSSPSADSPESAVMTNNQTGIQSFVILVLVNVHILFAVLEKGTLSLSRYLFKVFGSICHNNDFYRSLMKNESKGSLVVVLSWYDTVSAMVSPDCRLPYCSPDWYGSYMDVISTLKMMGCPGEIFRALSEVCFLRHEIHAGNITNNADFDAEVETVRRQLLNYREYVDFKDGEDYILRLKGAQCWSLAVYISLLRLFKTPQRDIAIRAAVHEFIEVYGSMPSDSPIVTQMVWPVYAVGCECGTVEERGFLLQFMDTLYETAQMGTLASLRWVVKQVWQKGVSQEEVLKEWLEDGVDYLPL